MPTIFSKLIVLGIVFPLFVASAQDGSVAPPSDSLATSAPATLATSTGALVPSPRVEEPRTALPATATPRDVAPQPIPSAPTNPIPQDTPSPVSEGDTSETSPENVILWMVLAALAIVPLGYLIAQTLKKENKEEKSRCFNLKSVLDKKFRELTDLKGKLESEAQGIARGKIKEAVQGTTAGVVLASLEAAEKEYGRLKKLYEECVMEFETKKQVIIVHGCPSNKEKAMDPTTRTHNKHWMPWIQRELIAKGIQVRIPLMPNPWEPNYEAFKKEFEKQNVFEGDTIIGHSCGAAFLIRWLGDSKQKIAKLILVAPWKIADKDDAARKTYYEYPIDVSIRERVKEIIIFTADNEEEDGKTSVKVIHDALGGKIIKLKGRGHYTMGDMKTEEFPELLEEVS